MQSCPSYQQNCLRGVLRNTNSLVIYVVNHSDLFLSQMPCMNTLSQILIFNFLSSFHCELNETLSVQPFNPSFGSRIKVLSSYWTRNKRNLLWFVYPSYIIEVAFCLVSLTCPPVNEFKNEFKTQIKFLKSNLKSTENLPLPRKFRSLLKRHVVLV